MAGMSRRSVVTVSSGAGLAPRAGLLIGGEDVLRVKAVRGNEVTVVRWRWRWRHSAGDRARRWLRDAREAAVLRWCAFRGHPLDGDICNCGERYEPEPDDDD